jgi:DnaJ like chaperone protein
MSADKPMSILGAILGGAAGFAVGGPIGALVGAAGGYAVQRFGESDAAGGEPSPLGEDATKQGTFTIGVIALGAKMAKADGRVTPDEIAAFKRVFRTAPEDEKDVAALFNRAKQDTAGFEAYARQLARVLEGAHEVKEEVIDCLFEIAIADGEVHPSELKFLEDVAEILGLSASDFARIRAVHMAADGGDPFAVLGLHHDAENAEIKARYRQLARDNHPDKLMAEGLPEEVIAVANQKLARINAAYDDIAKSLGIR